MSEYLERVSDYSRWMTLKKYDQVEVIIKGIYTPYIGGLAVILTYL